MQTCSWCGEERPDDMPLCRKCNPSADKIMAIIHGEPDGCVSCGNTPTRRWPVPEAQQASYGVSVLYCCACEPFQGEPLAAGA